MSSARSGPLKWILAQIRPRPARETGGSTPGSAQRQSAGFHKAPTRSPASAIAIRSYSGPVPGDDILLWVVDIRYTVGQPNFVIGRDLGRLPGALEDALTGG